jgi:hypothetical protein
MDHVKSCGFGVNDSGTDSEINTGLTQPRSGFDLPTIRELLKPMAGFSSTVRALRKQLSNYERGDAQSRAALKPLILRSVERIEGVQSNTEQAFSGLRSPMRGFR